MVGKYLDSNSFSLSVQIFGFLVVELILYVCLLLYIILVQVPLVVSPGNDPGHIGLQPIALPSLLRHLLHKSRESNSFRTWFWRPVAYHYADLHFVVTVEIESTSFPVPRLQRGAKPSQLSYHFDRLFFIRV